MIKDWPMMVVEGETTRCIGDVLACVVDEDYRGEIHLSLINASSSEVTIYSVHPKPS